MTPPRMRVSTEAVRTARKEFRRFGEDIDQVHDDLPGHLVDVRTGAGQFADALEGGANVFEASWLMALTVSAASSRTVATNMGAMTLDLTELDLA